ncbi:MAG: hypothetical protein IV100_17320 [Myxococcales bacterium]|nr:hypothetical protein [Myxococcales bacterium]
MAIVACGDTSPAAPVTTLPAEAITFVDDGSTLKAANVQVMLEGLDHGQAAAIASGNAMASTMKALEEQVSALQARVGSLETERDVLRTANVSLVSRVKALEDAPPPVIDVLATNVVSDILPAATLLVTLESLHEWVSVLPTLQSDVALLDGTTSALTSLSSALTECPEGTSAAGDFCMETDPRGEDAWSNATYFCAVAGGHVCTTGELSAACSSPGPLQPGIVAPELTTNIVVDPITGISGAMQLFDGKLCDFTSDKISSGNFAPYRCCYDRLVIGAGPKPAEPTP